MDLKSLLAANKTKVKSEQNVRKIGAHLDDRDRPYFAIAKMLNMPNGSIKATMQRLKSKGHVIVAEFNNGRGVKFSITVVVKFDEPTWFNIPLIHIRDFPLSF